MPVFIFAQPQVDAGKVLVLKLKHRVGSTEVLVDEAGHVGVCSLVEDASVVMTIAISVVCLIWTVLILVLKFLAFPSKVESSALFKGQKFSAWIFSRERYLLIEHRKQCGLNLMHLPVCHRIRLVLAPCFNVLVS